MARRPGENGPDSAGIARVNMCGLRAASTFRNSTWENGGGRSELERFFVNELKQPFDGVEGAEIDAVAGGAGHFLIEHIDDRIRAGGE